MISCLTNPTSKLKELRNLNKTKVVKRKERFKNKRTPPQAPKENNECWYFPGRLVQTGVSVTSWKEGSRFRFFFLNELQQSNTTPHTLTEKA